MAGYAARQRTRKRLARQSAGGQSVASEDGRGIHAQGRLPAVGRRRPDLLRVRTERHLHIWKIAPAGGNYGINLENYGVAPGVWVENTPEDELKAMTAS